MAMSLRQRFLLPTLALIIVGMGVATAVSYIEARNSLEKSVSGQVQQLAASSARQVGMWMSDIQRDVKTWAGNPLVRTVLATDAEAAKRLLDRFFVQLKKTYPFYELIFLANDKGLTVCASMEKIINKVNIKDRGYFQQTRKGRTAISKVILSRASGRPVVVVATPVMLSGGEAGGKVFGGMLGGVIDLAYFSKEMIDPIKVGKSGYVFVVNPKGIVIASPHKNEILKKNIATRPSGRKILKANKGLLRYQMDGVRWLAAFVREPVTGWRIVAIALEKELLAPARRLGWINLLLAAIVVLLSGVIIFLVARSITGPLTRITTELTQGVEEVASASSQASATSQSLAQGASEQAASLEQTSASLEEIASMTRQNADNAQQANQMMHQVQQVVAEATSAMASLKEAMDRIDAASDETAKIIRTIDEIAFQTNLLALNAAVEAARAGEAGAGFAVVADEVRALAMRAAEAARTTAELIEENLRNIKEGTELVGLTDQEFSKVQESAKRVAELVSEIAAASQEQSQGVAQINTAVSEMDKVVQQNAAGAQQSAAAAEQLSAQAARMKELAAELLAIVGGAEAQSYESTQPESPKPRRKLLPRPRK